MSYPERKKLRLSGYDYSQPGAYFITTCVKDRQCVLGEIRDGQMYLNEWGKIVHQQWEWLHHQYQYLIMDAFVVMPNHFHAILVIGDIVGNGRDRSQPISNIDRSQPISNIDHSQQKIKPVPELIGAFKTTSSKIIHQSGFPDFKWQKSYYEHIIRNAPALQRIRQYIVDNPIKWELDMENTNATEHQINHHYQMLTEA
ncbi:transposase [hot springs metagenome]|uniref:Transposase n=1 Tax=hot springs metagenome TaxID=433727 RepID=A0A5J4L2R3_9ZZZZ